MYLNLFRIYLNLFHFKVLPFLLDEYCQFLKWNTFSCLNNNDYISQVGSLTTASFTHCLCNHLSSFGGSFFVPPNRQVFIPEEQVEVIDHTTTFMILYVMGVALGVFLMVLGCGLVADWRFSKKVKWSKCRRDLNSFQNSHR